MLIQLKKNTQSSLSTKETEKNKQKHSGNISHRQTCMLGIVMLNGLWYTWSPQLLPDMSKETTLCICPISSIPASLMCSQKHTFKYTRFWHLEKSDHIQNLNISYDNIFKLIYKKITVFAVKESVSRKWHTCIFICQITEWSKKMYPFSGSHC